MAAAADHRPALGRFRRGADGDAYASSLSALRDLTGAMPGFAARLQAKEQLDARQRLLVQSRGSVEQVGMSTEQVQLRLSERVGEGTFCVVFRGELVAGMPAEVKGRPVAAKFVRRGLSFFFLAPVGKPAPPLTRPGAAKERLDPAAE